MTVTNDLYHASRLLGDIQLYHAAKWAAEAATGTASGIDPSSPPSFDASPYECTPEEAGKFRLAQTYFACKEFDRAASVLQGLKSGCCVFLRLYAQYIAIDKRASEESDGSINRTGTRNEDDSDKPPEVTNGDNGLLAKILHEIDAATRGDGHPMLLYLAGVIYNKKKNYGAASQCLFKSVIQFSYNWSAWQELSHTLTSMEDAIQLLTKIKQALPQPQLMVDIFEVVVLQQFHQSSPELNDRLTSLQQQLPDFSYLRVQQFLIAYHSLDYTKAEQLFDEILSSDPLRLDDIDTYSNMLFVMENRSKLSFLAHYASTIDKFRPETCIAVANYHSFKGEHEKAIMYFQRALALDKNCISAWTLMGHEFVELQNSHAAIECYRRAVDTDPKELRAWYGLGQAYEMLDMTLYALYYYQRAANLSPLDKRMWVALGNCFEKSDKLEEAIKAFEKAMMIDTVKSGVNPDDDEPNSIVVEAHLPYRLAILTEKLGQSQETHRYMKMCLHQEYELGESDETIKARLWLARYALNNRRFDEAYELAKEVNRGNAHDIEEARSIARDARNRMK